MGKQVIKRCIGFLMAIARPPLLILHHLGLFVDYLAVMGPAIFCAHYGGQLLVYRKKFRKGDW